MQRASLALVCGMVAVAAGCPECTPPAERSAPPGRGEPAFERTTGPPSPLPDLIISNVEIRPPPTVPGTGRSMLHRGMTYTFRAEVQNVGEAPVAGAVVVNARHRCPARSMISTNLGTGRLAPGERRLTEPLSVTLATESGGRCNFLFTADPHNLIAESNEENNEWQVIFDVP